MRGNSQKRSLVTAALAFGLLLVCVGSAQAQWTTSGSGDAYNTNSSGKVGIGTSGPAGKLDVEGGGAVIGTTGAGSSDRTLTILNSGQSQINYGSYPYEWSPAFQLQNNDNTKFVWISPGGSGSYSNYNARFYTRGTGLDFFYGAPGSEVLAATIANNGNFGIGTGNPGSKLEVLAASNRRFAVGTVSGFTAPSDIADGGVSISLSRPEDGALTSALYSYNTANGARNNMALSSRSDIVFLTASGPSNATERMRLLENGNFGIGTTSPGYSLEVAGNARTASTLYVDGDLTGTGVWGVPNVYLDTLNSKATGDPLEINYRTAAPTKICASVQCGTYSAYFDTNGNVGIGMVPASNTSYRLDVNGNTNVAGNITASGSIGAKYQDVAEWVPASEQLSAGTVVVLDSTKSNQVTSSSVSYDTRVAGVVSEQPGIALGEKSEGKVLVATTGRVRVKVDATKGPIHVGDLLVTSDVPGVAMKSEAVNLGGVQFHRPGTLIGKALEPLEKGKGEILVLLSLQ